MSYNKFFPHEVVREGQKQLLEDINSVFSNQKILLAHAPTGLGKTAATLTVAAHHALQHDKTIFFLTNRHTQHRIALDTLKQIQKKADVKLGCVDLIGKKWMCLQEIANLYSADFNEFCKHLVEKGECDYYSRIKGKKGLTVEGTQAVSNLMKLPPLHNHELINEARNHNMCAYELALEAAKKANVIICDYYLGGCGDQKFFTNLMERIKVTKDHNDIFVFILLIPFFYCHCYSELEDWFLVGSVLSIG